MKRTRISLRPVKIIDFMIYFGLGVMLHLFLRSDVPGIVAGIFVSQGRKVLDAVGPMVIFLFPQSILVLRHLVMTLLKLWQSWGAGLTRAELEDLGMRRMAARRIKKRATKYGTLGTVLALIYFFRIQNVDLTRATAEVFPVVLSALGSALITTFWGLVNWILADQFDDNLYALQIRCEGDKR